MEEMQEIEGGTQVSPVTDNAFLSGLSENDRALAADNGWEDAASVLDSYRALQEGMSNVVMLPDEAANPEEHSAFYEDISKSWTPKNGYRFAMPEGLPESFPYDQAFAEEASGWFKDAGLHPDAAQRLHDSWVGKMAEQYAAHEQQVHSRTEAENHAAETAHRELVREYGEVESDAYQNVVAKADRALTSLKAAGLDITGWFADKGALTQPDPAGLQRVSDPMAVKLLAFIHNRSFAEDGLSGITDASQGTNPFDSGSLNLKEQSEVLERNPSRARQMIVAAGRDPKLFRL